jgi:hypothetical protein
MKKVLTAVVLMTVLFQSKAQLTAWQKAHNKQVVFYDNWLQSRLDENDADATTELEYGNDFWFRAYFDDASLPKSKGNELDIRLSCEGVSVTINDMYQHAKTNFYSSNGILPNYDQVQIPGLDNFWKTKNVFSCCGFSMIDKFDEFNNYGCGNNGFYAESLLRFLLSKIDSKVIPGAVLNIKYEMVYRTKGEYRMPGGEYQSLAEGTLKMKIPVKEKLLTSQIYRLLPVAGMNDKALEETIKRGILVTAQTVISDVYKVQVVSNSYNIDKNYQGTPLNRWLKVRVVYKAKATGEVFTGFANVTFLYNGGDYDKEVNKVYFQCGNTFAPSCGVK